MRKLIRKTKTTQAIDDIVYALDTRLLETEKEYLLLAEANKHLVKQGLFSAFEQFDKSLKKLLVKKAIPHAFQTTSLPKQWRIPLSEEGERRKESFVKSSVGCKTLVPIKGVSVPFLVYSNKTFLTSINALVVATFSIFGNSKNKQGRRNQMRR